MSCIRCPTGESEREKHFYSRRLFHARARMQDLLQDFTFSSRPNFLPTSPGRVAAQQPVWRQTLAPSGNRCSRRCVSERHGNRREPSGEGLRQRPTQNCIQNCLFLDANNRVRLHYCTIVAWPMSGRPMDVLETLSTGARAPISPKNRDATSFRRWNGSFFGAARLRPIASGQSQSVAAIPLASHSVSGHSRIFGCLGSSGLLVEDRKGGRCETQGWRAKPFSLLSS